MSILDRRTRTKADIHNVDVRDFFLRELPSLIAQRGHLAIPGANELGLTPITFITPSGVWSLAIDGETISVTAKDDAPTAVQLSDEDFSDFIIDLTTLQMLYNLKRLKLLRGTQDMFEGWWAVLRSLVDGRPVYTAGAIAMLDRQGQPLDVNRSFTKGDDDAEIGHFLAQTGFLHLSGWFDEALMSEIEAEMEREFAACTKSDGSWWATLQDGTESPVRISEFASRSPALRRLIEGDAYQRIGRLTDDQFKIAGGGEAMQKPLNVMSGISSLPWHNDCALGMHSYKCCNLVVGISVTGAGPGSSQLAVLPGSHLALIPANRLYPANGMEPRTISTKTGDATVHCSCTLHMSENPTEYERKVIYTVMELPIDPETSQEIVRLQSRYHEVGQNYAQEDFGVTVGAD